MNEYRQRRHVVGWRQVRFGLGQHTTILELSLKQLDHSLRMAFAFLIIFYYLAELGDPLVEWAKVALVVHPRFIHVVEDLLRNMPQASASGPYYQAGTG